jgi:imidazolonepropionase-like amidohydrolase
MSQPTYFRNINVVDVVDGLVLADRHVVVRDNLIESLESSPISFTGEIIDGNGKYLCPGLIDCHVHFFWDAGGDPRLSYLQSNDEQKLQCAQRNARIAIEAGITTMRDCAAPAPLIFDLKKQIDLGHSPGPHVVCCGRALMRPKGHCHFMGGEVETIEDVYARIDWNLERGAKFVKLMASGGGLTPGTVPHEAELALDLMKAASEAAHTNGVPITAHCHATESISRAVEAELDMIEHANFVEPPGRYRYDDSIARRILDGGIVVCPTLFIALQTAQRFKETGSAHNPQDVAAIERLEGRFANTEHFIRLGIKIIGGTDCGATNTPFDSIVDEIITFADAGMTKAEALRTITSQSAEYLGVSDIGRISEGCQADLVLLDSDPFDDLTALRKPSRVFKSGELVFER